MSAPDPTDIRRGWAIIGTDPQHRRLIGRCCKCGHVALLSEPALEAGPIACRGCAGWIPPPEDRRDLAHDIAAREVASARTKYRGGA